MKEWDQDSYNRKYHDTLTVFQTGLGLKSFWVSGIAMGENKTPNFHVLEDGKDKIITDEPIYYRFGGRIILTRNGNFAVARRKITKSWQIGLSGKNHTVTFFGKTEKLDSLRPLDPVKVNVEAALKDSGPISEQLFVDKSTVYFLDRQVGLRKGTKFMVSESVWQEVKDSLQGFKCSISV